MAQRLKLTGRIFGAGLQLADLGTAEGPVWVQVARSGTWKGKGSEFTFDQAVFDKLIANFRSHPAFKAGPDGRGVAPVVPFDYEHASEQDPTSGTIPTVGAPAPAWALDLELRTFRDGTLELWALSDLSPQAREQIRSGGYRWTSVAVWMNAIDPESGQTKGPVLTSIAFTNHPFIQGMAPMQCRVEIWGEAESAEEFVVGLRDTLGLPPDAAADAVKAELGELVTAFSEGRRGPAFPDGVGWLLDSVRRLLGLRVLATAEEIATAAGQALDALSTSPSPAPAQPTEEIAMSDKVHAQLATIFGVQDKEDAILAASTKAAGAMSVLNDLMKKFGAADPNDLIAKATEAQVQAGKAAEFATKLTEALSLLEQQDAEKAEEEVEQVAASMGLNEETKKRIKPLLLTQRIAAAKDTTLVDVTGADGKVRKMPAALKAFREQYPVKPGTTPQTQLLTQSLVAGPNGLQLGSPQTGAPAPGPAGAGTEPEHIKLLASYPGANEVQRAIAYLDEKQPGFVKLDWARKNFLADRYIATGKAA